MLMLSWIQTPTWSLSDLAPHPDSVSWGGQHLQQGREMQCLTAEALWAQFKVLLLLPLHPSYGTDELPHPVSPGGDSPSQEGWHAGKC